METTLEKINQTYSEQERDILVKAYEYAKEAHKNQKRASGEPYFIHPCAVAEILIDLGLDYATIAAALLHDVIEDTDSTADDIKREFGEEILGLVGSVTKLEKIVFKSKEEEFSGSKGMIGPFNKRFLVIANNQGLSIIKVVKYEN